MSVAQPNYPKTSTNTHKNNLEFWSDLGIPVERIKNLNEFSERLYTAPVLSNPKNEFLVNDYSNIGQNPEGEIGLRAARKILGGHVSEDDEITIRMLDHQQWPEETYDASLDIVDETEIDDEDRERYMAGALMLDPEETSPEFDYGKRYDFIVFSGGSSTMVADQDYEFDLDDWR